MCQCCFRWCHPYGVALKELDIIWFILPKQTCKPIYKITKQGTYVWKQLNIKTS